MLLNDVYYEAGEIEAKALQKSSWAKPTAAGNQPVVRLSGLRRLVGRALIGLGELIAAERRPETLVSR